MEDIIMGVYVLSLLACSVCLWFWYELEGHKQNAIAMYGRITMLEQRIRELERKRR
jgi:hypothetical protein